MTGRRAKRVLGEKETPKMRALTIPASPCEIPITTRLGPVRH